MGESELWSLHFKVTLLITLFSLLVCFRVTILLPDFSPSSRIETAVPRITATSLSEFI